jgi:CubicO group peptidase (beta-lactamase class C family)
LTIRTLLARTLAITLAALATAGCAGQLNTPSPTPVGAPLDALVQDAMTATGARGLAVGVIVDGKVVSARAYGVRNAAGQPLTEDTIMYGASLTKAAFAYLALQLVDEGRLDLNAPIAALLPKPLPSYSSPADSRAYGEWGHLGGDDRWRKITPLMVLTHATGFANFSFLEPDGQLRFHFEPGARYAYSGEGIMLLQFGLERGLGLNTEAELQRRLFAPLGMTRTSLIWRADFAENLADGFGADGAVEAHDERSRVRAAGSMDTTIRDVAALSAGMVRGFGLSAQSRRLFASPLLAITSASQFPSLAPPPSVRPYPNLAAGLGVIVFDGPQGRGFFKGGHNDVTGNMMVCLERGRRCIVILANDVRAEAAFPALAAAVLGETGLPWRWEYGDKLFWRPPTRR